MANKEMSDQLEAAIKLFGAFLVRLAKWNGTEVEFEMRNLQDRLSKYVKDVRPSEVPTIQLVQSLAEAHARNRQIDLGIDPFGMTPLVRLESNEISF